MPILGLALTACTAAAPAPVTAATSTTAATTPTTTTATTLPPAVAFEVRVGGNRRDRGIDVIELRAGGYLAVGSSASDPADRTDIYLVRLDPAGLVLWERTLGTPGTDEGWGVIEADDGGFVVVGTTNGLGSGGHDVYLVRTDADGAPVWEATYGGAADEWGWAIAASGDGGYVLAGQTESHGAGGIDAFVIGVGPDGTERWNQTLGGPGEDRVFSITPNAGGFAVAGTTAADPTAPRDAYLAGLGEDGTLQWEQTFGGGGDTVAHAVTATSEGGLAVVGYREGPDTDDYDAWLLVTDMDGNQLWDATFGTGGDDRSITGGQAPDGGYVLFGRTDERSGIDPDVLLVRLDSAGATEWYRTYGGTGTDGGYTGRPTSDGGYVVVGETTSGSAAGGDLLLIKVGPRG